MPLAPSAEVELPPAQSLAASEVAKARAEQRTATNEPLAPEVGPAPEMAGAPAQAGGQASLSPAPKANPAPTSKRRRRRGSDKPAEVVASQAEAEHNQPTEAEAETGALTGRLILPSHDKPAPEPEKTVAERPKQLAPGEVYVDPAGNVIIGE